MSGADHPKKVSPNVFRKGSDGKYFRLSRPGENILNSLSHHSHQKANSLFHIFHLKMENHPVFTVHTGCGLHLAWGLSFAYPCSRRRLESALEKVSSALLETSSGRGEARGLNRRIQYQICMWQSKVEHGFGGKEGGVSLR